MEGFDKMLETWFHQIPKFLSLSEKPLEFTIGRSSFSPDETEFDFTVLTAQAVYSKDINQRVSLGGEISYSQHEVKAEIPSNLGKMNFSVVTSSLGLNLMSLYKVQDWKWGINMEYYTQMSVEGEITVPFLGTNQSDNNESSFLNVKKPRFTLYGIYEKGRLLGGFYLRQLNLGKDDSKYLLLRFGNKVDRQTQWGMDINHTMISDDSPPTSLGPWIALKNKQHRFEGKIEKHVSGSIDTHFLIFGYSSVVQRGKGQLDFKFFYMPSQVIGDSSNTKFTANRFEFGYQTKI